jgi:hypothetical protein
MIRNQLLFAALVVAGFVAASAVNASPVVIINQNQTDACTITPSGSTVFTLSTTGDVLINGSYTAGTCSTPTGGGTSGDPTFAPFSPAPADLTVLPSTLSSGGGNVTPAFVAYFANTCTGKVTATAGCTAIPAPWGTGGTVCNFQTNGKGQKYCQPSGTVAVPNNPSTSNACVYTFQAINCTNGTGTPANSQLATVTVPALVIGSCTDGDHSGDLGALGYARQCGGAVRSFNTSLSPHWTTTSNVFADIMSAPWPGSAAQYGWGLAITVNANGFGSFKFNTGSTPAGIHIEANSSYGVAGLLSVSTVPGDYFAGSTTVCTAPGSALNISSKSPTQAGCKLSLNTDYYLNVSNADLFSPHATDCGTSSCTTGWTVYGYGN